MQSIPKELQHLSDGQQLVLYETPEYKVRLSAVEVRTRDTSDTSIQVTLVCYDHADFPSVRPDDAVECSLYNAPERVSQLDALPSSVARRFEACIEQVRQTYGLVYRFPTEYRCTCSGCWDAEDADDGRLTFPCSLVGADTP